MISAERQGDDLYVRVADDGVELPAGWSLDRSAGFGLSVTRERLDGLYPARGATLMVTPRREGGVDAHICMPYEVLNGDADDDA